MIAWILCIIGATVALLLSGFYSGSETGLYCLNRLRLRVRADQGDARARRLHKLVSDEQTALSTLLVGTNVANYLCTISVAFLLGGAARISESAIEVYTTAIVTPIVFVFGEMVPKYLYHRHADRLMFLGTTLFGISAAVLRAPVALLQLASRPLIALLDPTGRSSTFDPRQKVAVLLREALAAESDDAEHGEMIDRVLRLRRVALHQVMVPRNKVVSIQADATANEVFAVARRTTHSRLPVYEGNPRRIIGYVQVHSLLADGAAASPRRHLHPMVTFDAHATVATAIFKLQAARHAIGAIVDRNGLLLGIVTLKDLLEELTGELHAW